MNTSNTSLVDYLQSSIVDGEDRLNPDQEKVFEKNHYLKEFDELCKLLEKSDNINFQEYSSVINKLEDQNFKILAIDAINSFFSKQINTTPQTQESIENLAQKIYAEEKLRLIASLTKTIVNKLSETYNNAENPISFNGFELDKIDAPETVREALKELEKRGLDINELNTDIYREYDANFILVKEKYLVSKHTKEIYTLDKTAGIGTVLLDSNSEYHIYYEGNIYDRNTKNTALFNYKEYAPLTIFKQELSLSPGEEVISMTTIGKVIKSTDIKKLIQSNDKLFLQDGSDIFEVEKTQKKNQGLIKKYRKGELYFQHIDLQTLLTSTEFNTVGIGEQVLHSCIHNSYVLRENLNYLGDEKLNVILQGLTKHQSGKLDNIIAFKSGNDVLIYNQICDSNGIYTLQNMGNFNHFLHDFIDFHKIIIAYNEKMQPSIKANKRLLKKQEYFPLNNI